MKTILQIAEEEGAEGNQLTHDGAYNIVFTEEQLERFAARIRAEQKELDAKICDKQGRVMIGNAIRNASPESDIDQLTGTT